MVRDLTVRSIPRRHRPPMTIVGLARPLRCHAPRRRSTQYTRTVRGPQTPAGTGSSAFADDDVWRSGTYCKSTLTPFFTPFFPLHSCDPIFLASDCGYHIALDSPLRDRNLLRQRAVSLGHVPTVVSRVCSAYSPANMRLRAARLCRESSAANRPCGPSSPGADRRAGQIPISRKNFARRHQVGV
jgi:hypothetical protein